MPDAVIVSALRTPIGTAVKGTLRDTDAYQLAEHVVGAAVADLGSTPIDDVILGEGLYGGGVVARGMPRSPRGCRRFQVWPSIDTALQARRLCRAPRQVFGPAWISSSSRAA
jgi:hypothetical protein